jgi:flagellar hook-length control protein FliK
VNAPAQNPALQTPLAGIAKAAAEPAAKAAAPKPDIADAAPKRVETESDAPAAQAGAATATPRLAEAAQSAPAAPVPEPGAAKIHEAAAPAALAGQVQQAAAAVSHAAAGNAAEKLSPRVGTPAWDQALGQKVVWMVAGGVQSASLTLNPPDLGPLQVVLNVSNSHADASFVAPHAETRQALEASMPRLREMLADSGIQLGQSTVSAGTQQQYSGPNEQPQPGLRQTSQPSPIADAAPAPRPTVIRSAGNGLVVTFA